MKQTMKYLSMAALVVMGAILDACSKKETVQPKEETPEVVDPVRPEEPVVEDNIVVCTTTVSFDIDETKALNEDGVKTFATGDRIAVIYKNTGNQTVKAVSESLSTGEYDHTATFTVTLTNPAEDAAVRIIYPAAMAAPFVYPGVAVDADATINYAALSSQDGTLASLSSNLDLAVYDGNLIGTSLPADPALENKLAICMYTLKNSGGEEITGAISGMTVNDGTYNYSISRSAAAGPIYVAIRPTDNATVKYTATNGSIYYSKSVTGKTYAASEMYPLGLIMAVSSTIDLSKLNGDFVATHGEVLQNTLGGNYKISIADGATVTLDGVTIEGYEYYSYDWAGITCQGNATILFKGDNTVKGFFSNYPGIYVPAGKTLTILGEGSLLASSNGAAAGIGGGTNISCGNICIGGGVVTAVGGSYCAGIGAGYAETTSVTCGTITITGGDVTAEGGANGAGIGSGGGSWGYTSTCGDILISAGTVNATGGQLAAGIGSGSSCGCGDITISGGTVTATKGEFGSDYDPYFYSIGPGYHGSCGTVTIGDVTGPISTSPYTFPSL